MAQLLGKNLQHIFGCLTSLKRLNCSVFGKEPSREFWLISLTQVVELFSFWKRTFKRSLVINVTQVVDMFLVRQPISQQHSHVCCVYIPCALLDHQTYNNTWMYSVCIYWSVCTSFVLFVLDHQSHNYTEELSSVCCELLCVHTGLCIHTFCGPSFMY